MRGPDAGPATGGVTGHGGAGALLVDLDGGEDGVRGDVPEGHVGRGLVVHAVGGAAGELGTEHGDALAELRAEALAADLQVDDGGAAELGQADQVGDDLVPPDLLNLVRSEGQLRHLVHEEHDGNRAKVRRQVPDVGCDLCIRQGDADALLGADELIDPAHVLDERGQEMCRVTRVVGKGGEPRCQRREFHAVLTVDTDERSVPRCEPGHERALIDGLPRFRRTDVECVRDLPVVPVVHFAVFPQGDRHPECIGGKYRGHPHPFEHVVSGHPQLHHAGADLARDDVVEGERVS